MKIIALDFDSKDITTNFIIEMDNGKFAMYCQAEKDIQTHYTPEFFVKWNPDLMAPEDIKCKWELPEWLADAILYNFEGDLLTRPLVDMSGNYSHLGNNK